MKNLKLKRKKATEKKVIKKRATKKTQAVRIKKNKTAKFKFSTLNKINSLVPLILIISFIVLPLKPLLAYDGDLTIIQDTVLSEDINGSVIIGANNIVLDCNGYKIIGSGGGFGVFSEQKNNITIKNCVISNFEIGIYLRCSSNNKVLENDISNNKLGIDLSCIVLMSDNLIYHNNFKNNQSQSFINYPHNDLFDNGYPEGGNYWSDYAGQDLKKGENQNQNGSDGICLMEKSIKVNARNLRFNQPAKV